MHQAGYLQGSYQDARSTKQQKKKMCIVLVCMKQVYRIVQGPQNVKNVPFYVLLRRNLYFGGRNFLPTEPIKFYIPQMHHPLCVLCKLGRGIGCVKTQLSLEKEISFFSHYILAITYTIALLLNYCIAQNTYTYIHTSHICSMCCTQLYYQQWSPKADQ